jgi:tetratricopeptide (TPR) repeat protein
VAFTKLQFYKLYLFWNGDEIGRNQELYFARQYSSLLQVLLWKYGIAFPFGLLAPLALTGFALGWRRGTLRRPESLLLGLFTATYMLSVVAFFISARYRLPVIPPLLLFAAYGGRELYQLWRQRAYGGLLAGCGTVVALLVVCNWGVGSMDMDGDAQTHYRLGYVYEKKGLPVNAIVAYHKALELDPDIKWARFNLASQYARRGDYGRAIAVYRDFNRRFPDVERARLALGNVYLQTRRYPEAIGEYRRLQTAPGADTADIQGRLGYAYTQAGRLEEAVEAYGALIAVKPDSLQARFQWGQLHETLEHPDIARSEYEKILAVDPSQTAVRHRLARLLFFADEPLKARTHLEHAIALDPQAVDARLLLATQYIVERRASEAMDQVQAILAMQPEHQQANRLIGHLYMAQGDTIKGVEYLGRFTEYYREGRSAELFKQLKEQWDDKLQGPQH